MNYTIQLVNQGHTIDVPASSANAQVALQSFTDSTATPAQPVPAQAFVPAVIPVGAIDGSGQAGYVTGVDDNTTLTALSILTGASVTDPADNLNPSYAQIHLGDGSTFLLRLPAPLLTASPYGTQAFIGTSGDFNGDGVPDLIVTISSNGSSPLNEAGVYIIFGGTNLVGDVQAGNGVVNLLQDANVIIRGVSNDARANSAGDVRNLTVNGNNIDDILITNSTTASGQTGAYLFYGTTSWPQNSVQNVLVDNLPVVNFDNGTLDGYSLSSLPVDSTGVVPTDLWHVSPAAADSLPDSLYFGQQNVQTVTINATSGTWNLSLTIGGQTYTLSSLAYNIATATLQTDLQALAGIGTGNVTVTGTAATFYMLTFAGNLANASIPLAAVSGTASPSAQNLTQTYDAKNASGSSLHVGGYVTSPQISLSSYTSPSLTFNYYLGTESELSYDQATVQISTNGTSWTNLASSDSANGGTLLIDNTQATQLPTSTAWNTVTLNLAAYAGQSVQIRFSFDSIDGFDNDNIGWFVDNIQVQGIPLPVTVSQANAIFQSTAAEPAAAFSGAGVGNFFGDGNNAYAVMQTSTSVASPDNRTTYVRLFDGAPGYGTITSASNSRPVVITTTSTAGLVNGESVNITGNAAANGTWTITAVTATSFQLVNSGGNGSVVSGGTFTGIGTPMTPRSTITSASGYGTITGATNASPIVITTSSTAGLVNGATVTIVGVAGNTAANGTWTIAGVTSTTFQLVNSVGNGTYSFSGTFAASGLIGPSQFPFTGQPIVGVGNLDNDGSADLVINGYYADYVIFGGSSFPSAVPLSTLLQDSPTTQNPYPNQAIALTTVEGPTPAGLSGTLVQAFGQYAAVGDVNGDGVADLGGYILETGSGYHEIGIVFIGGTSMRTKLKAGIPDLVFEPQQPTQINNSAFLTNIYGAFLETPSYAFAGIGNVVSPASNMSAVALADGPNVGVDVYYGQSLEPAQATTPAQPPQLYVYAMTTQYLPTAAAGPTGVNLSEDGANPALSNAFALDGTQPDEYLSQQVESIGDINGDGQPDLLVSNSSSTSNNDLYDSYVIFGPFDLQNEDSISDEANMLIDPSLDFTPAQKMGDLDGDGRDDLIFYSHNSTEWIITIILSDASDPATAGDWPQELNAAWMAANPNRVRTIDLTYSQIGSPTYAGLNVGLEVSALNWSTNQYADLLVSTTSYNSTVDTNNAIAYLFDGKTITLDGFSTENAPSGTIRNLAALTTTNAETVFSPDTQSMPPSPSRSKTIAPDCRSRQIRPSPSRRRWWATSTGTASTTWFS